MDLKDWALFWRKWLTETFAPKGQWNASNLSIDFSSNDWGGYWRHYKGGRYLVLAVAATHEHNGDLDVVYVSLKHDHVVTRPLRRDSRNQDSWRDLVRWPDGFMRERFLREADYPPNRFNTMFPDEAS